MTTIRIDRAQLDDAPLISALNNLFAPDGLTLHRTPKFVAERIDGYRVARDEHGAIVGCVAVDDYAPSVGELVSLAVAPDAQGKGLGHRLINEAERVARQRNYDELFAISLADGLFLSMGWDESSILRYPEKQWRYRSISRSEMAIGRKFCFTKRLRAQERESA